MQVLIWIIVVLLALPVTAYSSKHPDRSMASEAIMYLAAVEGKKPVKLSPQDAARKVKKSHGGKILSVKLGENKAAYRVKILTEAGVVKIVSVPANR
ncbi:MAG: hypothetical protein QGD92_06785 [Gammaproteobacteria bacterium]|nr:hypothetical protein [Gammaproteobacteria bacterium]